MTRDQVIDRAAQHMLHRRRLLATMGLTLLAAGCAAPAGSGSSAPTVSLSLPVSEISSTLSEISNGFSGALGAVSGALPSDVLTKAEGLISQISGAAKSVVAAVSDPQVQTVVKAAAPVIGDVLTLFGGAATGGALNLVIAAAPTLLSLAESLAGIVTKSRLAARATMSIAQAHAVMQTAATGQL